MQQFKFNDYKPMGYDVCIFNRLGNPALLFEYDGWEHYDKNRIQYQGGTSGRGTEKSVAQSAIRDVKKIYLAFSHNVPCIRLNKLHLDVLDYIVESAIHYFVLKDTGLKDGGATLANKWFTFPDDFIGTNESGGCEAGTDTKWTHMRWAIKEWIKDPTLMPELVGLSASKICDIVNMALPDMCDGCVDGIKKVQPKHMYKWKAECKGEPSHHEIDKIQDTINKIRAEARRRINEHT